MAKAKAAGEGPRVATCLFLLATRLAPVFVGEGSCQRRSGCPLRCGMELRFAPSPAACAACPPSACPRGGGPGLPPSMMNGGRFHPPSPPPLLLTGLHHPLLLRLVTSPSALGGCVCSGASVHQGGQWEGEEAEVGREARRCWLSWPGGWSLATPTASPRILSILILLPGRSDDTGSRLPRWAPPLVGPPPRTSTTTLVGQQVARQGRCGTACRGYSWTVVPALPLPLREG